MLETKNSIQRIPPKWYVLGPLIAMVGGLFGIFTAAYEEMGYGLYVGTFAAAPIFEEAIKPCGVYWLLGRRPYALPSQRYTACLAALAGLTFGIIESLVYLGLYYLAYEEHDQTMIIWRFTVCLLLHTTCSFIVGFGINQKLAAWVRGEVRLLKGNRKFFLTAMIIHSCYNIFAWILETKTDLFPDPSDALILFGFIW